MDWLIWIWIGGWFVWLSVLGAYMCDQSPLSYDDEMSVLFGAMFGMFWPLAIPLGIGALICWLAKPRPTRHTEGGTND